MIPAPPLSGVVVVPARRSDTLLGDEEIAELESLAQEVNAKIPPREAGVPWDIEFGFFYEVGVLSEMTGRQRDRAFAYRAYLDISKAETEPF